MPGAAAPRPSSARGGAALKILIAIAAAAVLFFVVKNLGGRLPAFAAWVQSLGPWGPAVYIGGYALAAVLFLPGSLLTMAAGVIFGLGWGTVYSFIGATLGASLSFLVGRTLARKAIEKKVAASPKFAAIDRAVAKEGGKFVALLRLSPVLPFNLLNYALGLTKVGFVPYLVASLAMLPGTLLYVYYGTVVGDLAKVFGGAKIERGAEQWVFFGAGLLATLLASLFLARRAKQAIAEAETGNA